MEVRDRILSKAHELFCTFGFRRVTMDEIAVKTGMSKKTIYQSFSTKDEMVDAVVEDMLGKSKDSCIKNLETAENAVHEMFLNIDMMQELMEDVNPVVFEDLQKFFPPVFEKFFNHKYDFIKKKISDNLKRGIKEGIYRPDINVDILTKYLVETLFIPMNQLVYPYGKYNIVEVENEVMQHFLYGICNEKGQQLIIKYKDERLKTN